MKGKCVYCGELGHNFSEACPLYISNHKIAEEERARWNEAHAACPKCGNTSLIKTLASPIHIVGKGYRDDINSAECHFDPDLNLAGCGWKGMENQLVPKRIQIWD